MLLPLGFSEGKKRHKAQEKAGGRERERERRCENVAVIRFDINVYRRVKKPAQIFPALLTLSSNELIVTFRWESRLSCNELAILERFLSSGRPAAKSSLPKLH